MKKLFIFSLAAMFLFAACADQIQAPPAPGASQLPPDAGTIPVSADTQVKQPEQKKTEEKNPVKKVSEKEAFFCNAEMDKVLIEQPFDMIAQDRGAGKLTLKGKVITKKENIWGVETDSVFLVVDAPAAATPEMKFYAFKRESQQAKGKKYDDPVEFKLGVLKDGKLDTTAEFKNAAGDKIVNALKTKESIELTFRIGRNIFEFGLPVNFTEACRIEY